MQRTILIHSIFKNRKNIHISLYFVLYFRILLSESGFKLALHSATILDGMMLVFGGNPYDNQNQKDVKCHSSTLLSYDFGE